MADESITLGIILEHLRAFERRFLGELHGVDQRLGGRMGHIESRMNRLEDKMERVHRNLSSQLDAIDKRLDAVEIEFLPKRVQRIEKHLGLAAIQ